MASRAGSPNKSKKALLLMLQERYPGYQPVLEMADAAHNISRLAKASNDDSDLWAQASAAHDKVAQYVTPKLKAMEVTGEDGEALVVKIVRHGGNSAPDD